MPSTRWSLMPTWSSIWPSSSWVSRGRAPASTSREPALSSRPPWPPSGRGGWCTPRRWPPTAIYSDNPVPHHRGCSGPRITRARLLRAEGRLRSGARGDHRRLVAGGVRASAVHRRRTEGARARRRDAVEPAARPSQVGHPGATAAEAAVPRSRAPASTRSSRRRRRRNRFGRNHFRAAGAYNIAGDGVLSMSEVAEALGARPVRVPKVAMSAASEVIARLPFVPSALEWLHVGRTSVVMDTSKAKSQLGWTPKYTGRRDISGAGRRSATLSAHRVGSPVSAGRSMWHHLRPTSRRGPRRPWPDRSERHRPRPRGPRPIWRSSGCLCS